MQDKYVINHYFDNEWRILILSEENNFAWEGSYSETTDEGFNSSHEKIWVSDGEVFLDSYEAGRDCDGYTSHSCSFKMIGTEESNHGFLVPVWERVGRARVYDQYAQAAGY